MQHVSSFRIQPAPLSLQQQPVSAAVAATSFAQSLRTIAVSLLVDRALSA
jgi:hypothetical protein